MGEMHHDTRAILRTGWILLTLGIAGALLVLFTGGMGPHGPRADIGWLGLLVALACLPLTAIALLLGGLKYRNDRRH